MPFQIFESEAKSILSPVSGFLAEAGFTPAEIAAQGDDQCMLKLALEQVQSPDEFLHRVAELYQQLEMLGKMAKIIEIGQHVNITRIV